MCSPEKYHVLGEHGSHRQPASQNRAGQVQGTMETQKSNAQLSLGEKGEESASPREAMFKSNLKRPVGIS